MFFQIVETIPQYASSTIKKLRSLIDLTKGDAIIVSFDSLPKFGTVMREKLPPYSVEAIHTPNDTLPSSYAQESIKLQTLYTEMPFLWSSADEIPADCHRAILEQYLFTLLSSIVSRYSS